MSVRVSLRGMLRLIRVDTLRRVNNVGFLAAHIVWLKPTLDIVTHVLFFQDRNHAINQQLYIFIFH